MDTRTNLTAAQQNIEEANCVASPRATLGKLDGYMNATGYGADHPWRTEIATALAAPVEADASIEHALAAVNAADLGMSNIDELATLIETIAALAEGGQHTKDSAVRKLAAIQRISRLACHFAAERKDSFECVRNDLAEALAAMKGGVQ